MREGRAAALNMIPSSTGAAIAVTQAYPALANKFDGISIRVPTPAGSIADITFIAKKNTSVEEVNNALRAAAKSDRWKATFPQPTKNSSHTTSSAQSTALSRI
jgi:glyceraldehyde 3-phosphate dehydrogenase